ncbi:MAG: hypothetical protein [Olavius algarvensis Gamma 1 endosymbiont]|nr:MAG: hypothetical protein [Olavius algarvensis Gamma 1 endosymbiont]
MPATIREKPWIAKQKVRPSPMGDGHGLCGDSSLVGGEREVQPMQNLLKSGACYEFYSSSIHGLCGFPP